MAHTTPQTRRRLLLKALSYRLVSYIVGATIIYLVTHHWYHALSVGAIDAVSKFALYLAHESIWDRF